MPEITDIITATEAAYIRFAAGKPDQETRDAVKRIVRFLVVDLESINELAMNTGRA